MVDSVGNVGGSQRPDASQKVQKNEARGRTQEKRQPQEIRDEVSISREALSRAEAEKSARDVREQLEKDESLTLSNSREEIEKKA